MPEIVPDAPDHDVLEQDQPVPAGSGFDHEGPDLPTGIEPEVNEADAIEQALPGPILDEDDAPR